MTSTTYQNICVNPSNAPDKFTIASIASVGVSWRCCRSHTTNNRLKQSWIASNNIIIACNLWTIVWFSQCFAFAKLRENNHSFRSRPLTSFWWTIFTSETYRSAIKFNWELCYRSNDFQHWVDFSWVTWTRLSHEMVINQNI